MILFLEKKTSTRRISFTGGGAVNSQRAYTRSRFSDTSQDRRLRKSVRKHDVFGHLQVAWYYSHSMVPGGLEVMS